MSYRIPVVTIQLVRERTMASETKQIKCAEDAAAILMQYLQGADREHFVALTLDTKHKVTSIHTVSIGSLDASIVHPREVLKPAILGNASGVLVGHNHPSGDPTPSPEDIAVTRRLAEACKIIGIDLLDHVVVGDGRFHSLKALGYM